MSTESFRVAILGAGLSGICMGIKLRQRGITDFVMLEKASAVGGTWRENTYPGIACDVPSHLYSYSFELNPEWTHSFSPGAEIWAYCERCVDKYGLTPHLRFNSEVADAQFIDGRWHITTRDGAKIVADVLVSGLGGLHCPNRPDITGNASFSGTQFHTAQWDHDHDLKGRHVAMIGTGASAAQVLPNIAADAASVTVFQRSAAWVFPRLAHDIPEARRTLFRRFPLLMRAYRSFLWLLLDVMGVLSLRRDSWMNARLAKTAHDFLARSVSDPVTRAKLTPDYTAGCKRRCIADDYLETFNRDNVHLVTDGIAHIEADGIRDRTGKLHAVDTIIEATGFKPFDITDYVDIRGQGGRSLREAFAARVESFRSVMVPGFPNFFLLLGPNSATGHTSALIMIESQADYVVQCLQMMDKQGIAHIDPSVDATQRFNQRIQRDMKKMVFSGGCSAWYTDKDDVNFTLWPYSAARFLMELHRPLRDELVAEFAPQANR